LQPDSRNGAKKKELRAIEKAKSPIVTIKNNLNIESKGD
jgi:hypothetical protein